MDNQVAPQNSASRIGVLYLALAAIPAALGASPAVGLVLGIALALVAGNPVRKMTAHVAKQLLQISVILLGFGLSFGMVVQTGRASAGITLAGILLTMAMGWLLGRILSVESNIATLLSGGTAICGGSAIAALAPAIGATAPQTAVALAAVFLLNAAGLLIFPPVGHWLGLSEADFGLWAALAIHDTSSVVGAAASYGGVALAVATSVKLTRALWILPLAMICARLKKSTSGAKWPWFLLGFIAAAGINSYIPEHRAIWAGASSVGRHCMTGTLFLIGLGLTRDDMSRIGVRPLLMAVILWAMISSLTLGAIVLGWRPLGT